jgi:ankyrin repeat protein
MMFDNQNLDFAKILIDKGADTSTTNKKGKTVIHLASELRHGHGHICLELLPHKAKGIDAK